MNNFMSDRINAAGQAAEDARSELTPEEIEALKKKRAGMFQKIKDMLGYSYADSAEKQMPK